MYLWETELATEQSDSCFAVLPVSPFVRLPITVVQNFKMTFDFLNTVSAKILVVHLVKYSTIILPATTAFGMGKVGP
jgi:hypothetical protein